MQVCGVIEGCHEFLKEYKENGLQVAISAATTLATDLEVEPDFQSVKRVRQVKSHFHYEAHDKLVMTPELNFETDFYTTLLHSVFMSIKERLEQLYQHGESRGLLYKISDLPKKKNLKNTV
jgi:hypothetical protein